MKKYMLLIITGGLICFSMACQKDTTTPSQCQLEPEVGPCNAAFVRYYFDQNENSCKEFIWGGCAGVVPFETLEDCQACIED